MKKLSRYFLIAAAILLFTAVITSLVYCRDIYRILVAGNEKNFPPAIVKIINKLAHHQPEPKIIPKKEETIKILEGWTINDIGEYLENSGIWKRDEFFNIVGSPLGYSDKKQGAPKDFSDRYSFLKDKPKYYGLEGYLFPDTYRVYSSSTPEEITVKMLDNFNLKLTPAMRQEINRQGKTIYSIIIMASIIEKEAPIDYFSGDNRDGRIISGIFWNRLKAGQGLESDATLSYLLNDNKPRHAGKELTVDSPYNTYKYRGLPPTPICNPGILAIEAAIYPINTDYNYFLTPKGKSTVIYARTYEEHLDNKNKYLK